MEDSLKGILITCTLILIFIVAILSYITIFPAEQEVTFNDAAGQNAYLLIQNNTDPGVQSTLNIVQNNSYNSFNAWSVVIGFMGSNSLKANGVSGPISLVQNVFSSLDLIVGILFTPSSPVVYVLDIFLSMSIIYIVYVVIKWVRTGD